MKKGQKMSEKQKLKISNTHKSLGDKHWTKRPEVKKKMAKTWFVKGQVAWNEGKPAPWAHGRPKGFVSHRKGKNMPEIHGEKHHNWKGDKVGLSALHSWVKRELGVSPEKCTWCDVKVSGRRLHLANKSGEYKRDLSDWIYLCVKCHWELDRKSRMRKLHERKLLKMVIHTDIEIS